MWQTELIFLNMQLYLKAMCLVTYYFDFTIFQRESQWIELNKCICYSIIDRWSN